MSFCLFNVTFFLLFPFIVFSANAKIASCDSSVSNFNNFNNIFIPSGEKHPALFVDMKNKYFIKTDLTLVSPSKKLSSKFDLIELFSNFPFCSIYISYASHAVLYDDFEKFIPFFVNSDLKVNFVFSSNFSYSLKYNTNSCDVGSSIKLITCLFIIL